MEKYLGNKRALLESIFLCTQELCPDSGSMADLFAGTTNVGRFFKRKGFEVISNDINRFSYVLASNYLNLQRYPTFEKLKLPGPKRDTLTEQLRKLFFKNVLKDRGQLFPSEKAEKIWTSLSRAVEAIHFLNRLTPKSKDTKALDPIVDFFTAKGKKSAYKSVRGTRIRRNYFSINNARKISAILGTLRGWWRNEKLSQAELYFLLTSLIEEIVIVANVNGTFHDFNRDRLWPNALQDFLMKVPLAYVDGKPAQVYCQDAKILAPHIPPHDILYIDPPYNFRQYAAYYHFLNFIAAYVFLPSLDAYMDKLSYVRGQNTDDDYTSDFCFRDRFVNALREVIIKAPSKYVVLSYFNGRNHWNHWSKEQNQKNPGFLILEDIFKDKEIFSESYSSKAMQTRINYQSRVGEKKGRVNEYIFWGKRVKKKTKEKRPYAFEPFLSETNRSLSLNAFSPD
jgi:adenine-specific DNA-methyltransferase